ncbi:unnamed protein product, partial [Heterosigma akashiwo]
AARAAPCSSPHPRPRQERGRLWGSGAGAAGADARHAPPLARRRRRERQLLLLPDSPAQLLCMHVCTAICGRIHAAPQSSASGIKKAKQGAIQKWGGKKAWFRSSSTAARAKTTTNTIKSAVKMGWVGGQMSVCKLLY